MLELTKKCSFAAKQRYKVNLAHLEKILPAFDAVNGELEIGLRVSKRLRNELKAQNLTLTPEEFSILVNLAMDKVVELCVEAQKTPSSSKKNAEHVTDAVNDLLDCVKAYLGNYTRN